MHIEKVDALVRENFRGQVGDKNHRVSAWKHHKKSN